jgi:hypothetical protein
MIDEAKLKSFLNSVLTSLVEIEVKLAKSPDEDVAILNKSVQMQQELKEIFYSPPPMSFNETEKVSNAREVKPAETFNDKAQKVQPEVDKFIAELNDEAKRR